MTPRGVLDLTLFCTRPRKAYLSPALIWLEEEGLSTAEMEAKALGGDMDKEAVMRRATEKWRRMSVEEKAVWRARAEWRSAMENLRILA